MASAFQGLFDIAGIANAFIEKQVAARKVPGSGLEQPPSKLEHLFGCSSCNYSELGCKHCYDTPFASRPAARAKPKEGRYHNTFPPAPSFHPTAEEWQDPFAYLSKIAPEATKAGIALIVPPKGWEPPIQMLDQETGQLRTDLQVPVRIQPTHLLCRRWPTPAGAPPPTPQKPLIDMDASDAEEDKQAPTTTPSAAKKSNAVTGRCSKANMVQHKAALAAAAAAEAEGEGEDGSDGQKDVILNPAHLDAVATAAQATDGQFGYEHLEEPLSLFDFHRYADWAKRRHFHGPLMAGLRKQGPTNVQQQQQQDGSRPEPPPVVSASTAWRVHPPTAAVRAARGVAGRYLPGSSGSNAAAGGGSSSSSSSSADWEEPSLDDVEAEFWRIVEVAEEQVEALYGQDIDSATYCSAFPTIRELTERQTARLMAPPKQSQPQRSFGCVQELAATIGAADPEDPCHCVSTCDCGSCQLCVLRAYSAHPWNINNIPQAKGSVLRFVREDVGGKPITGLMVPWVYVGSCFSAFCWHIEDHGLYSINYHHMGAPKVWYGVPAAAAAALDTSMRDALPHLFDKDHLLLHKLITMLSPAQLAARGVPVCRAVQVPGSFIVTFPDAYHAGFNSGFNVAEAVNFAAPDWLPFGSSSVVRYRNEERYMTFSHDAMLINVVKEAIEAAASNKQLALPAPLSAGVEDNDAKQAPTEAEAAAAGPIISPPAAASCSLKQQFQQRLEAALAQLDEAEAVAAGRQWWQRGEQQQQQEAQGATRAAGVGAARLVAPPGCGGSSAVVPAVDFSTTPLDSSFWWAWYPEESWADAAVMADEAAAEALHKQQGQQQQAEPQTPSNKQQKVGEGHHLAAASVQHHPQGQRERVFTMRGAIGSANQQQPQQRHGDEEEPEITPGVPAAGAAAAAAAAGPPPRVVAAAARGLAVAAFTPAAAKPPQQQQRKHAPNKKGVAAAASSTVTAAAATNSAADAAARPSVAERVEAAVKAITTYTLCLAEARRQKLLVRPPSQHLARLALGELALRVELEQQRQTALQLQAGVARTQLMVGNSAATDPVSGVHTNTQGVECAVCGCDLSLAAVVSSEESGRAVCPAHAADLDGPRSSAWLLLRYAPGYLDQLVATGLKMIPGAAEAVAASRRRQSWVAAGRFYGGTVLHKAVSVETAAAAAADVKLQQEAAGGVAAAALVKQEPAAAAVAAAGQVPEQQQGQGQVPVIEVKLLGPLYDPAKLSSKLFEDIEAPGGGSSSSQSRGWEDGGDDDIYADAVDGAEQQQRRRRRGMGVDGGAAGKQQQQTAAEGDSGGDVSSGSWWQEELEAEDAFGFFTFGMDGSEGEDALGDDTDDDFRPSAMRGRKRRRAGTAAAAAAGGGRKRGRAADEVDDAKVEQQQQQADGAEGTSAAAGATEPIMAA